MPEITRKIGNLIKEVDKLIDDAQKDIGAVIAAGKDIKDSFPKREKEQPPDDKQEA